MANENKAGLLHASERDGVQYRKAKLWEMIIGNANNGCGICFYLLMMYASYIGTEGYGIVTVVVGTILMAMRIFDGATDALGAAIFEKINPKHGKIRIFLVTGWVLASLGVLIMYSWAACKFSGVAGFVVFILSYIIYILGYTINGLAGGVIGTVITNDPTQRPMNGVISTLYSYLTPMVFNTIIAFAILPKYDNQYNAPMLKEACYLYVIVAGVFMVLACIGVSRFDNAETFAVIGSDKKEEKIKWRDMWAVLRDNKDVQRYIVTCASDKFAQQTASQSVITTMASGILIGSYTVATMIGNFTMIVGIAFAFLGGIYVAKNGAKKATSVWSWASIAIAVVTVVFCTTLGPTGMSKIGVFGVPMIIYALLQLATIATKMILTTTSTAMRADCVDAELERTGKYMPAVVGGVYSFIDKLITSVSSLVATICIAAIGYVNTVPQMGDKPTWEIFIMTMALSCGLPILGWLCNVIAMRKYTLSKERMIEIQKNVAEAKAEAMSK